ncbi:acyl-CoA dehydrogenase family protein [Ureibacillus sp. FSL K6-8385]|uniref:Acyl-CoA dehydrogenase n=1 Tax=Ureibacillus terrenus TaxID=118246 RepID=A0A540V3K8_9BACL|nr:acyl-CoA dehydrogenase family protein [Ureibacillus terrenus]MED3661857.1 acyl-CoA/acyl-ACP dehydrogenase [Ureibacillus terrenus]MED3763158.1 acyl-CoA/acyl-ACP dehydrogenase [Ureibacillus terrenus]TQE91336.1 acyl-CoA dehydrogenase [Ureibacillus terrenus]
MGVALTDLHQDIREGVREICSRFDQDYWRKSHEEHRYPTEFVKAMSDAGWLGALIPEEYGGSGLGFLEGAIILEEINRSGGNANQVHAQLYTMGALLRHGSEELKRRYLPQIASGELRLQTFAVTEPDAGTDTTKIKTRAVKKGDKYIINGQKIFISRFNNTDLLLLLARTTPLDQVQKKTHGISLFLVDKREVPEGQIEATPIDTMLGGDTNQLFFNDLEVPAENLIGEEGRGLYCVMDGMVAERILVSGSALGNGKYFIDQAVNYGNQRIVFDRPITQNQGIQFPIAKAYMELRAAEALLYEAARKFDEKDPTAGADANMAKYLCSEAAYNAAEACMQTFGGYAAANEYHINRKWMQTRMMKIAPISSNLILSYVGQHVLKMPRSF